MNKEQADVSAFKRKDAASYDDVTGAFDRFTERFTGSIAERVVELASIRPGDSVLDVGCGTGVVSFAAARRLTGSGRLVGIDLSDGMLAAAREKASRGRFSMVEFRKMDAEALDLADAQFDAALSMFALRHFPHPEAALAQMSRVLRPGGRLVVAVGSAPSLASRAGLAAAWRRLGAVGAGLVGRRDLVACAYLDRLVEAHLPPGRDDEEAAWIHAHSMHGSVERMVADAGFRDVRSDWAGNDGIVPSKEDFWDVQVTFSTLARKRLPTAPADAVARLRREFDAGCERAQASGGKLRYPTGALIVVARKPG